jgi:hypothetical protein
MGPTLGGNGGRQQTNGRMPSFATQRTQRVLCTCILPFWLLSSLLASLRFRTARLPFSTLLRRCSPPLLISYGGVLCSTARLGWMVDFSHTPPLTLLATLAQLTMHHLLDLLPTVFPRAQVQHAVVRGEGARAVAKSETYGQQVGVWRRSPCRSPCRRQR